MNELSSDHRRLLADLAAHIGRVPIGHHEGRTMICRGTTDADVIAWLKQLDDLRDRLMSEMEILGTVPDST